MVHRALSGWLIVTVMTALAGAGCRSGQGSAEETARGAPAVSARGTLKLSSSAFSHQGEIPRGYTCEGEDRSPPLAWSGAPGGTKSLALIVEDPDAPDPAAPQRIWVHWVLYNLPSSTEGLAEAVSSLPAKTLEGQNDWRRTGYGGPCPPIGRHRYFHLLYALDQALPDLGEPTRAELLKAMEGHVLDQTELIGTYQKQTPSGR